MGRPVVVLGGGISGLAACFHLTRGARPPKVSRAAAAPSLPLPPRWPGLHAAQRSPRSTGGAGGGQ